MQSTTTATWTEQGSSELYQTDWVSIIRNSPANTIINNHSEMVEYWGWGVSARGKKLLYSLVVRQQILIYSWSATEQLAYNVPFYVGLAPELYLAVGLSLFSHIILGYVDNFGISSTKLPSNQSVSYRITCNIIVLLENLTLLSKELKHFQQDMRWGPIDFKNDFK